ncbi:MAG TPA: hypothetical protein DCP31_19960 [Cyanobacteria bacterium UBA8543]|nr:hypothetical protein [Cyanobacteria bacterium UBA8543]
MNYRKIPINFLLSITGIFGLITILSACGTNLSDRTSTSTPTSTPDGVKKTIQRAIENLPKGQQLSKNTLLYQGPIEQTIPAGSFLSGTNIKYVGLTKDNTAEVSINGQRAFKRSTDSLDWTGSPVKGVQVQLSDRILWLDQERLRLAGTIRLKVDNVTPKTGSVPKIPDKPTPSLIVYKVPVIYRVKRGEAIPGTTLTYVGNTEKGAQLGGGGLPKDEYPYRQVGDSIAWQGQLRSGVYLNLLARTVLYNEDSLNVTGLATIILSTGDSTP